LPEDRVSARENPPEEFPEFPPGRVTGNLPPGVTWLFPKGVDPTPVLGLGFFKWAQGVYLMGEWVLKMDWLSRGKEESTAAAAAAPFKDLK